MGSWKWVSIPSWVTSTSGLNAPMRGGTTSRSAHRYTSSPVYGKRGTFTENPRPAPDPVKLAGQFAEWVRGETLPGRMLANLKTGRMPEVLAAAGDGATGLVELWQGWERGKVVPLEVAQGLADGGLVDLLGDLAEA